MQTTDAWQIKLVFNRYKSTVIELPPNWSTHRVWRHVHTHHPHCGIHVVRRPNRYGREGCR